MGRTNLRDEYFSWLYSLVGNQKRSYLKLCKELHSIKFKWFIHNDDNRCDDGLILRDRFIEDKRLDEGHLEVQYFLKGECTVLEVLVALAQRINELMYDLNNQEDRTPKWFLEMLQNLGLNVFMDGYQMGMDFDPGTVRKIATIVEVLMKRSYDFYGVGGLFPLKRRPPEDQAQVEIWYQLMRYLDENYGL